MQPDTAVMHDFLTKLYGGQAEGWITLATKGTAGGLIIDWARVTDLDAVVALAEMRAVEGDVWLGVALRRERLAKGRGGAADCLAVPGLWLDVDIEGPGHETPEPLPADVDEALDLLSAGPLEPSLVVHSGGGLQPYWLFESPVPPDPGQLAAWHQLWSGLAEERGYHLDNVSDVARVMRLPGTFNHKTGTPRPVTIIL